MQVQSLSLEDPLEKEMATHSNILAWEILWTEEPGGLQSMGQQKVRHNLVTKQQQTHVQVCVNIVYTSLGQFPRTQLLGHMVVTCLVFKKLQAVLQSGCTILHSHQQCISDPVFLNPHQFFVLLIFFYHFSYFDIAVVISHCGFNLH